MADLGSLTILLEANIAQFNRNMDEAARRTEQSSNRMQTATNAAKAAIGALAGVVSVGFLVGLARDAIDAADNLRDMSQKTGIAVEELNGLGFAAGQAGGNLETMVAAAGKLNKSIVESLDPTSKSAEAFKALGISTVDASGNLKKADVVMAEVADQFAKYEDGPEKAALALTLFGKSGADMIPLLNDGGDALRENTEYAKKYSEQTTNLSNMSDEFNDTMGKLTVQQNSFGNALAEAVLPAVNLVATEILGATEKTDKFSTATTAIRTVLETIIVVGAEVAHIFHMVGDEIGGTAAQLVALGNLDFKQFSAIGDAMKEDQARALVEHEAFLKKVLDRTKTAETTIEGRPKDKPAAPKTGTAGTPKTGTGKSAEEKALEDGAKMVASLKRQEGALGLTGVALLTYNMTLDGASEAQIRAAQASQTTIDAFKAEEEAAKKSAERVKKDAADEQLRMQQNASNVEQIRQSLLTEAQAEDEFYNSRIEALRIFNEDKLGTEAEFNALVEEETARHEAAKAAMKQNADREIIGMAGDSASQLYGILQQAGMEQTALGKALFIANKAIAVAEIIMNTEVAAAKALTLGPIVGPPLSFAIRAMGYASAGVVIGTTIASAEGGYDIPAGANPVTQLHEKEMVLPRAQADVIRGLAANGGSGGMKLTLINNGTPQRVIEQRKIAPDEYAMIVEDAKNAVAADLSNPNSRTSRAMKNNFNTQRSR